MSGLRCGAKPVVQHLLLVNFFLILCFIFRCLSLSESLPFLSVCCLILHSSLHASNSDKIQRRRLHMNRFSRSYFLPYAKPMIPLELRQRLLSSTFPNDSITLFPLLQFSTISTDSYLPNSWDSWSRKRGKERENIHKEKKHERRARNNTEQ